jgi:hypothetical protein
MSHFYAHADAGEPAVTINDYDPAAPFAVVSFGATWDITSTDPDWCRRVARAWDTAASALEAANAGTRRHAPRRSRRQEARS